MSRWVSTCLNIDCLLEVFFWQLMQLKRIPVASSLIRSIIASRRLLKSKMIRLVSHSSLELVSLRPWTCKCKLVYGTYHLWGFYFYRYSGVIKDWEQIVVFCLKSIPHINPWLVHSPRWLDLVSMEPCIVMGKAYSCLGLLSTKITWVDHVQVGLHVPQYRLLTRGFLPAVFATETHPSFFLVNPLYHCLQKIV